jgi:hypothetical protein
MPENLDRLARALTRMNAAIRIEGESVPTRIDGAFLANMPFIFRNVGQQLGSSREDSFVFLIEVTNELLAK